MVYNLPFINGCYYKALPALYIENDNEVYFSPNVFFICAIQHMAAYKMVAESHVNSLNTA